MDFQHVLVLKIEGFYMYLDYWLRGLRVSGIEGLEGRGLGIRG